MQRIVELSHRHSGVSEGRMFGDILDPLAVNPDLPAISQRLKILGTGKRAAQIIDDVFRPSVHRSTPSLLALRSGSGTVQDTSCPCRHPSGECPASLFPPARRRPTLQAADRSWDADRGIISQNRASELGRIDLLFVRPRCKVRWTIGSVRAPAIEHRTVDGLIDPGRRGLRSLVGSETVR